jgi:N-acetylglucosamine-6-phosphate deacetylase
MMRLRAAHHETGQLVDLSWEQGTIQAISPAEGASPPIAAQYVAPAFFDLQINGCGGHDFSSETLTLEKIRTIVATCRQHGIGALCPTLITNSFVALRHGMTTLRRAVESDAGLARAMPAIHLEGPYIAAEDGPRGAHPRQHVRPPDWDEFQRLQEAAGGRIRLVTLAPEHEGALTFIERLARAGVVVAIGHTAASGTRIRDAITAGARLSTHLGNGCHLMLPRHENYLWEQLAADELWASIICDGHHLPRTLLRCILRVKTAARLILTCDASSLAGLPPGRYLEWGQEMEIQPEGKIVVAKLGVLAGSWAFTDLCVGNAVRLAGASLPEAIAMATERPRQLLGLPVNRLEPGAPADLVLFDMDEAQRLHVRHTVINGELV